MDRSVGREEVLALVSVLAVVGGASLRFTQIQSRAGLSTPAGRGTRLFFSVATWVCWSGSVVAWLLVLAEAVLGPFLPTAPVVLALALALVAPPIAQMNARLRPVEGDAGQAVKGRGSQGRGPGA